MGKLRTQNLRNVPRATYRVQLTAGFGFADLTAAVPYLARLGISHLYLSPVFRSRAGSQHGYDVTNHSQLNPELGGAPAFAMLAKACGEHRVGIILDIVPNHMAVMTDDNAWWMDVLENGPASRHAGFFDIDWNPARHSMRNRLLVPALERPLGEAVAQGEITICFDEQKGTFHVACGNLRFPVDPASCPLILCGAAGPYCGSAIETQEFTDVVQAFASLPPAQAAPPEVLVRRERGKEEAKRRLAALCGRCPGVALHVRRCLDAINTDASTERNDHLVRILAAQPYRLAYWRVAGEEVNYRRFFDVNELAALRVEEPEVFERTHGLIRELWRSGGIDGLRVDHADGLYRPARYLQCLHDLLADEGGSRPLVVVEKILGTGEELPADWPVDGTTGYEFGALLTGWLAHPQGVQQLERIHQAFVRPGLSFAEIVHESKKRVMHSSLAAEITMLAHRLDRIAQASYSTSDFTLFDLRQAVVEVIASFPVYRTYVSDAGPSDADVAIIRRAVGAALGRKQAVRRALEFLGTVLVGEDGLHERMPAAREFCMRFQQVTGPVMAKGVEDTAFYRYSRLLAFNEVGADPQCRGVSTESFHRANERRAECFPQTLLATSTHDSKRGEDCRFRLCVLTEVAPLWRSCLARWRRLKRRAMQEALPEPEMEYLLLQSALGIWPVGQSGVDEAKLAQRLGDYALKAAREAKVSTSWLDPDAAYEALLQRYVQLLVPDKPGTGFERYFAPVIEQAGYFGVLNSVAAVAIKLTVPGIPDIYQGNEGLRHVLVDPDNRAAIDFTAQEQQLSVILGAAANGPPAGLVSAWLKSCHDGRLKTFVTWSLLELRRAAPELFSKGGYEAVPVTGPQADHLIAYRRMHQGQEIVVAVARWQATLAGGAQVAALGEAVWQDTGLQLPAGVAAGVYRDVLTGQQLTIPEEAGEGRKLGVGELFASLPLAVLVRHVPGRPETS